MEGFWKLLSPGSAVVLLALVAACEAGGAGVTEPPPCSYFLLSAQPRDTAVYVDGAYRLRVDIRGSAACSGIPVYEYDRTLVAIDSTTGEVRGRTFGRARIILRGVDRADTVFVSVVPRGKLAVSYLPRGGGAHAGVFLFETDLTGLRRVVDAAGSLFGGFGAVWLPSGRELLYHSAASAHHLIYRADTLGAVTQLVPPRYETEDSSPTLSPDGAWVYFSSESIRDRYPAIFRIPLAGGAMEEVWRGPDRAVGGFRPSISPDGSTLALTTWDAHGQYEARFVDLGTGAELPTRFRGEGVTYSPAGGWLSYWDSDRIWVARVDGTDARPLTSDVGYAPSANWSADGEWLAVSRLAVGGIELIQVRSGVVVPLPATDEMGFPSWHPGG